MSRVDYWLNYFKEIQEDDQIVVVTLNNAMSTQLTPGKVRKVNGIDNHAIELSSETTKAVITFMVDDVLYAECYTDKPHATAQSK